jgi:tetratricopeptide (TPR) repeat protein
MQKYGEALAALGRAIELVPGKVGYWRNKGNVLGYLGRCDEALDAFAEAERLDPMNPNTFISRGALLANKLQRYAEALGQFDRAIALGACEYDVHLSRARVLRGLKRSPEALQAADQALAVTPAGDPRRVEVFRVRGQAVVDLHLSKDPLAALLEASRLDAKDVASLTDPGLGPQDQPGRHEAALAAFEGALALDARHAVNWHSKSFVLRSMKRYGDALAAIENAILCQDDDPNLHSWRGILLHNDLRRFEEALAAFGKALQLDSQRAVDWTNKSIVLRSLKRYDEALEAIDEAIRLEEKPERHALRAALLDKGLRRNE